MPWVLKVFFEFLLKDSSNPEMCSWNTIWIWLCEILPFFQFPVCLAQINNFQTLETTKNVFWKILFLKYLFLVIIACHRSHTFEFAAAALNIANMKTKQATPTKTLSNTDCVVVIKAWKYLLNSTIPYKTKSLKPNESRLFIWFKMSLTLLYAAKQSQSDLGEWEWKLDLT